MPCHQRENQERGYEWYYAHLSSEDQAHVDAKFITLLNDVAFTTLEPSEQAETLQNIKEQLIDYIIEMEFSLRRRP